MIYLEKDQLNDSYVEAKEKAKFSFEPYDEFERLAANGIRSDLPSNYPKVNDGSLAALLIEAPNSILQGRTPEGSVKVLDRDEAWLAELANIEWQSNITKHANTQAEFEIKNIQMIEKALNYGASASVSLFTRRGSYTGADFYIPYIKDVILEPGKVSDIDSDYVWVNVWYTKLQVKNIIETAKEENKLAKEEGRESSSPWDLKQLQEALDAGEQEKDQGEMNQMERDAKAKTAGIKFRACYQRGVDAPFYMLNEKNKCVRSWTNQDPTGDIPVHFMYCHQNLIKPYGRGKIELAGSTQNVLDYTTQANVLAMQIGLEPPVQIKGSATDVNLESMVYARRQFWFTGNAQIETVRTTNEVHQMIANFYGLTKSQLMNLLGRTDGGSVSTESGNPQFSKTSAGVNEQANRTDANDNAIYKNFSTWYSANARSMLNIHFANMEGTDIRKLLDDERDRLYKAAPDVFTQLADQVDPETGEPIPATNELEIVWDNTRAQFDYEVDPSSNEIEDEKAQLEGLTALTESLKDPSVFQALSAKYRVDLGEAYSTLYKKLGVENVDKILIPITPEEQADMAMQGETDPSEGLPTEEPQIDEEQVMEIQAIATEYAIDEQGATAVHQAIQQGVPREEIEASVVAYKQAVTPEEVLA